MVISACPLHPSAAWGKGVFLDVGLGGEQHERCRDRKEMGCCDCRVRRYKKRGCYD